MKQVKMDRSYYPLSDVMYQWLQQNAPYTYWDQRFGYTFLEFRTEEAAAKFLDYMKKQYENKITK